MIGVVMSGKNIRDIFNAYIMALYLGVKSGKRSRLVGLDEEIFTAPAHEKRVCVSVF